jgi:hypothetical protein
LDLNLFNATRPVPAFHLPLTPRLPCHEVSPHLEILRARQQHLVTRNSDSSRTPISSTTIEIFPFHYNVYAMDSPPSDLSPENESVRGRSQGQRKRIRVWTEDDRAKHRVFEKNRREAFSDSLTVRRRSNASRDFSTSLLTSRFSHRHSLVSCPAWRRRKRANCPSTPSWTRV